MQITSFLCHIILLSVACLAVPYVSTLFHKGKMFEKKIILHEMGVLIFSKIFVRNVSHLKRIQQTTIINVHRSSCKIPISFVRF
jgi:hypothetical protein